MLTATIVKDGEEDYISKETIEELSKLLGAQFLLDGGRFIIQFDDVKKCEEWVRKTIKILPSENFYLIGEQNDSLIKSFPNFQVTETLYYLLIYVANGDCYYKNNSWKTIYGKSDPTKHKWISSAINTIKNGGPKDVSKSHKKRRLV